MVWGSSTDSSLTSYTSLTILFLKCEIQPLKSFLLADLDIIHFRFTEFHGRKVDMIYFNSFDKKNQH